MLPDERLANPSKKSDAKEEETSYSTNIYDELKPIPVDLPIYLEMIDDQASIGSASCGNVWTTNSATSSATTCNHDYYDNDVINGRDKSASSGIDGGNAIVPYDNVTDNIKYV